MNCEVFRKKVSAVIDNEISTDERKNLLAHRAECVACDRYATEIEKVDAILRAQTFPELPPDLVARLKEIELEWTVPYVPWGPYVRDYLITVAGAVAILFVSMMGPGYWRDIAVTLIPAVAWAAVLVRLTVKGVVPAGAGLLEARELILAHKIS